MLFFFLLLEHNLSKSEKGGTSAVYTAEGFLLQETYLSLKIHIDNQEWFIMAHMQYMDL